MDVEKVINLFTGMTLVSDLEIHAIRDIFLTVHSAGELFGEGGEEPVKAVQQILSKGVVSGAEFKVQLCTHIPCAYMLMAQASANTGLVDYDLDDFTQGLVQGKIDADTVLPEFARLLNEYMEE